MSEPGVVNIAVIICSQRNPRVGPEVSDFVLDVLKSSPSVRIHLHTVDLAKWNLPIFNESTIPATVSPTNPYQQPHSRAWSAEVIKYDGFVFVTPQYNWGYPASVKNAIDYLYHEWKGKSAMVVSYGNRGGDKAAAQLRQVLQGVRMQVVETMPGLVLPSSEEGKKAYSEQGKLIKGATEKWEKDRVVILRAFGELRDSLLAKIKAAEK